MLNQVKQIDIFGADFSITIENSRKMKTTYGALMTVLTFCFFVFVVISFGDDFYNRKNPKVIIQRKVLSDEELYDLNNSTVKSRVLIFKVTKLLDDISNFLVDASIPYSFQNNKTYGMVQSCNHTWVLETFYPDDFSIGESDLKTEWSYLCYNMSDFMFGLMDNGAGQGSALVNPVSIWTFKCGRSARGVKGKDCPAGYDPSTAPNESVDIELWTEDVLFDQDNLLTPFSPTLTRAGKYQMTRDQYIEAYISMLVHKNFDNKGFLLDTEIETDDLGFGSIEYLQVPYSKPKDFYDVTIFLGYDKIYTRYHRTYMKVQDLLALVGGILKFVITFFQIISYYYNEYFLTKHLILHYYDLNKKNQTKLNFNQLNSGTVPSTIPQNHNDLKKSIDINNVPGKNKSGTLIHDNSNVELNIFNKVNNHGNSINTDNHTHKLNNNFMKTETQNTISHRHNDFGFGDYLKFKLGCSKPNLVKEIRNIKQKQGIEHIFSVMKDIYLLKQVLLTPEQSRSMKLIRGKAFDFEDNFLNEDQRLIEKEIFDYFAEKLRSNNMTDIDMKLLEQIKHSST